MAGTIGSLYVKVDIDTKRALRDIAKIKTAMRNALSGGATGSTTGGTAGAMAGVAANTKAANSQMSGLTKSMMGFNAASNAMRAINPGGSMGRMASSAQGLKAAMSSVTGGTVAAGIAIGGVAVAAIAGAIAIGAWVAALKKVGSTGLESASTLERLKISFESVLGSASAARTEIGTLIEIAKESPYLTDTVLNLDKFLASQGVYSGKLRGGLVNAVLDLGSALGLADANIDSITYALSQVSARGYLSGDEYRQLANQFIPIMATIKALPEYADMSNAAIRKLIETGQISSTTFFEAFIAKSQDYSDAAIKMANSVEGLKLKIQDIYEFGLGGAFLNVGEIDGAIGPLDQVRDLLREVALALNEIDFRGIAAGFGEILSVTLGRMTEWVRDNASGIQDFFSDKLPRAIHITAQVLAGLTAIWAAVFNVVATVFSGLGHVFGTALGSIKEFGNAWTIAGALIALPIAVAAVGIVTAFQVIVSAISVAASLISAGISLIISVFYALWAVIGGGGRSAAQEAVTNFRRTTMQTADAIGAFAGSIAAPLKGISAGMHVFQDIMDGFAAIGDMKLPDFSNIAKDVASAGELANMAGASAGSGKTDGGGGGGSAAKTVDELAKVMDMLWDLTRRWFDLRSDLEVGLLGKEGFEATIWQIAAMGEKLVTALQTLGADRAVDIVYQGTVQLMALAEKRDELADRLESAEKHLESVMTARSGFTDALRTGAMKFANALQLETTTIETFETLDSQGSFAMTSEKKTKSFADGLAGRVDALREFVENMRTLSARGLDKGLLEEMLAAGPDQAGEVAKQLAEGSDAMISEVNVLEAGARELAEELAAFGAKEFHDTGVAMAEAEAEGLRSELSEVEAAAMEITQVIYDVVEAFAVEMADAGAAAGGALASGLAAGFNSEDFEASLPGMRADAGTYGMGGSGLPATTFAMPDWYTEGLTWLDDLIADIEEASTLIHDFLSGEIDIDFVGWWDGLTEGIGAWWADFWRGSWDGAAEFVQGVADDGFWTRLGNGWANTWRAVDDDLGGFLTDLAGPRGWEGMWLDLGDGWSRTWRGAWDWLGDSGESIKGISFSDVYDKFTGVFANVWDWLDDELGLALPEISLGDFTKSLEDGLNGIWDWVVDFFTKPIDFKPSVIKDYFSDKLTKIAEGAIELVDDIINGVIDFVGNIANEAKDKAVEIGDAVREWVENAINVTFDFVGNIVNKASEKAGKIGDKVREWIKNPINEAISFVGNVTNNAWEKANRIGVNIRTWVKTAANATFDFVGNISNKAWEKANGVGEKANTWIKNALNATISFAGSISLTGMYEKMRGIGGTLSGWVSSGLNLALTFNPSISFTKLKAKFYQGVLDMLRKMPWYLQDMFGISNSIGWLEKQPGVYGLAPGDFTAPAMPTVTQMSAGTINQSSTAVPEVHVFIGDQELRGLVNTEIVVADNESVRRLVAGRRS